MLSEFLILYSFFFTTISIQTDWLKYFNGLIGVKVDKNEEIMVSVPEFVKTVDKLLSTTSKRTIANYMVWRIVLQSVSSLNKPFRNIYFNYQRVINGNSQEPPR